MQPLTQKDTLGIVKGEAAQNANGLVAKWQVGGDGRLGRCSEWEVGGAFKMAAKRTKPNISPVFTTGTGATCDVTVLQT